jgi:tetrahydromethanopterin S-methyltransferase subunit G
MAFTVNDLNDLLRILREQPEWLAEVRRVVLTDELLKLPDLVRELVEAQRRTDERLAEFQQRIEQQMAEFQQRIERQMAEFQQRIERQMAEFQQRIERQIAEFQQRTDQRFAELAEAQRRTDERLAEFQQRTEEQIGELKLEMDYRAKVGAIFGSRLKKPKVVDAGDMWDVLRDRLDEEEIRQIVALDLIVRGRLLPPQGEGELWLAVEVSYVVDQNDVMRAAARAALLRKAGLPAIPVAAGKRLTQGASALATESRVVLVQDGSLVGWDDALQDASGERPSAA